MAIECRSTRPLAMTWTSWVHDIGWIWQEYINLHAHGEVNLNQPHKLKLMMIDKNQEQEAAGQLTKTGNLGWEALKPWRKEWLSICFSLWPIIPNANMFQKCKYLEASWKGHLIEFQFAIGLITIRHVSTYRWIMQKLQRCKMTSQRVKDLPWL